MEDKKRVLVVSLDPYPNWGTGSNLFKRILYDGHLLEKLGRVDVLTYKHSYCDKDEEWVNGVKVYRLYSWRAIPKYDLIKLVLKHPLGFLIGVFQKVYYRFLKKYFDKRFFNAGIIFDVYNALVKLKANEYDCIITIVCPYEGAIAVSRYVHKTGGKFIMWQGDPCSTNMTIPEKYHKEVSDIEKDLLATATATLSIPCVYNDLLQQKIIFADNNKVIPMELPLIVPRPQAQQNKHISGAIKCVFVGNIYCGIRDPKYTIRLFDALDVDFAQLHIYGVTDEQINFDKVIYHGSVALDEALCAEDNADFLVNIGNLMTNQVPSKIFEYISTGKPIINICKNRNCPSLPYFEKYPLVLNLFEEDNIFDEQVGLLKKFLIDNRNKCVSLEQVQDLYKECTAEYCAEKIWEKIKCPDRVSK